MEHAELKLGGVVEAALNYAMNDKGWLKDIANDEVIPEHKTEAEVFQALENFICECLARKKPKNWTIREIYDYDPEVIDPLLCDTITKIIQIPGVSRAVLGAALDEQYYLKEFGPETVADIPFQYIWDTIMWSEEADNE